MRVPFNIKPWRAFFVLMVFLFFLFGSGVIGYQLAGRAREADIGKNSQEKHQSGYRFINPLLECEAPASFKGPIADLRAVLSDRASLFIDQNKINEVSIYFRDLNSGDWVGINDEAKFSPASLMKVPILIAYLKLAENDRDLLDKKLQVTMEREEALYQNIIPDREVETGKEYTVWELLEYMIIYSDNLAANTLLENIDTRVLDRIYNELGIYVPTQNVTENFISVRNYASFFRVLFNSSYLNREMSEKALELLSRTEFDQGMVAGLPSYIIVAHKFGERRLPNSLQLHDCGIVYRANNPYLLCIMTRGNDFNQMASVIESLSSLSFEKFDNR